MDDVAFAAMTKQITREDSRRNALRVVIGGLTGAVTGLVSNGARSAENDIEQQRFGICRTAGFPCGRNQQCCSDHCNAGICGCLKKGKSCINRIGADCCSGSCRKGKCK